MEVELSQCNNINARPYLLTSALTYETTTTNHLVANTCVRHCTCLFLVLHFLRSMTWVVGLYEGYGSLPKLQTGHGLHHLTSCFKSATDLNFGVVILTLSCYTC